jgi:hypothetical protein
MKKVKNKLDLPIKLFETPDASDELIENNQQSAKKAIKILVDHDKSFIYLTGQQKRNLVTAFASKDKIVYGRAFDIIKLENEVTVNFNDIHDIIKKIKNIIVCEIKSTRKEGKRTGFAGHFFGLSTAELLVAQNLKGNYKFIFVNINTEEKMELTLNQIFVKAKGIYPQWSISF